MSDGGVILVFAGIGLAAWLLYDLLTGRRDLLRFLVELLGVYGPLALILLIAITVHVFALWAIPLWVVLMLAGGRQNLVTWLDRKLASSGHTMDSQHVEWVWTEDPNVNDPHYFGEWFDVAVKDGGGFYAEQLLIGEDGRIDPTRRADGSTPMLPAFFHQVRLRRAPDESLVVRGPTVEELYQILSVLQRRLSGFEFIVEEDPQRRWIKYRVRR